MPQTVLLRRAALCAALVVGRFGCADAADGPPCALSVSISGYLTATMPEQITCGGMIGGIDLLFQPTADDHPISGFQIVVDGVARGETGDFPATVLIYGSAGGVWQTDACSVTIEEHTDLGRVCHEEGFNRVVCEDVDDHRVRGRGACTAPARAPDDVLLTVGPFEFGAHVWWPR